MKQLYRWIICLLLTYKGIVPVQGSASMPTNGRLKFGAKLSYVGGFYLLEDSFSCFSPALFIVYPLGTIDQGSCFPLFGFWGVRYLTCALQVELRYQSLRLNVTRCGIEPKAAYVPYPDEAIRSVELHLKTLSLPILFKSYIGKNCKFSITNGFAPLLILSVYKKDWVAELADQPEQGLLKQEIYINETKENPHRRRYHYEDPEHKKAREAFYNVWKKRKEKDQRTYLSVRDVFNGRIGLELIFLGMEYETNKGFILNWDVVHFSFFGKSQAALSTLFSIGYNFNKLLHDNGHDAIKPEVDLMSS